MMDPFDHEKVDANSSIDPAAAERMAPIKRREMDLEPAPEVVESDRAP
jgi:hypothetical protein